MKLGRRFHCFLFIIAPIRFGDNGKWDDVACKTDHAKFICELDKSGEIRNKHIYLGIICKSVNENSPFL